MSCTNHALAVCSFHGVDRGESLNKPASSDSASARLREMSSSLIEQMQQEAGNSQSKQHPHPTAHPLRICAPVLFAAEYSHRASNWHAGERLVLQQQLLKAQQEVLDAYSKEEASIEER